MDRPMKKRNLTVALPYPLVRKAKEMAVREDRSLNDYVRAAIEEKIENASGYAKARERQLARLEQGLALGTKGRKPAGRDALHERS
jgi:predicted transcriptional regulator